MNIDYLSLITRIVTFRGCDFWEMAEMRAKQSEAPSPLNKI
jgi:hypothetical protein